MAQDYHVTVAIQNGSPEGRLNCKYSLNPYECKEVSHKAHEEHRGRKKIT